MVSADGPGTATLTDGTRARRRRRLALGALVAVLAVAGLARWVVRSSDPALEPPTAVTAGCTSGPVEAMQQHDVGSLAPTLDLVVTDVRLVGASNVEIVGAMVAADLPYPWPPVVTAPPRDWRTDDPTDMQWDWSQAGEVPGAALTAYTERDLLLQLRIVDPDEDAWFDDVEVVYTTYLGTGRHGMGWSWRAMGGSRECPET